MAQDSTSTVIPPIAYKISLKRLIVTELRNYFYNISVSNTMNEINCTLEYPNTPEKYPAVIVNFKEKTLHNAGLGHIEEDQNISIERWLFAGNVTLEVMALTNLERDFISDHLVGLFSFGNFLAIPFEADVVASVLLDVQPNLKVITPIAERTMAGVTWGVTDSRLYVCGYSFPVQGSFTSNPSYAEYITKVTATTANAVAADIFSPQTNIVPPTLS